MWGFTCLTRTDRTHDQSASDFWPQTMATAKQCDGKYAVNKFTSWQCWFLTINHQNGRSIVAGLLRGWTVRASSHLTTLRPHPNPASRPWPPSTRLCIQYVTCCCNAVKHLSVFIANQVGTEWPWPCVFLSLLLPFNRTYACDLFPPMKWTKLDCRKSLKSVSKIVLL